MSFDQQAYQNRAENRLRNDFPPSTPPQEPPLFVRLVTGAETISEMAASIESRLDSLMTRATGPVPKAEPSSPRTDSVVSGHLGALDVRLTNAMHTLQRIASQLDSIERVI